ncbi:hypothetical protein NPX13_g5973 [Xylaria arbuscula]|uniref:PHD and RING finger domain-containing protein n=1 Tax=Xylaria arbuscula TaxID=114810 RepID=A0A9W8TKJ3_9PEZI|nr:hypothetical protein NPX13_g5973 [Xylaria arbuscula]
MADQCIVCLDNLDVHHPSPPHDTTHHDYDIVQAASTLDPTNARDGAASPSSHTTITDGPGSTSSATTVVNAKSPGNNDNDRIAVIQVCGHVLHDSCLREWTEKANSCPICRQAFHLVHVYDKVGGTLITSYKVEDKKQVHEFDPQAWLDENPEEEEETRPCPICNNADHEDLLLLCDGCDAPYHTYCVGLDTVPRGHWFCLECAEGAAELLAAELDDPDVAVSGLAGLSDGQSDYLPRTQATMRRARQRARSDEWQGAWGQIAGRVWDALNIDLDNHEDDEALHHYRRSQQRSERERREYQRWQQRLNIASRLGAHDVFVENLPIVAPQQSTRPPPVQAPPPQETREEKQAWGALERAMEAEAPSPSSPNQRKRKARSVTASPVEPPPPERKLKRPRTRRVPTQSEASTSNQAPAQTADSAAAGPSMSGRDRSPPSPPLPVLNTEGPSFLSSLLKEVEMSTGSDDESIRALLPTIKPTSDPQSPVTSPSPSGHSSPRALSMTPPPRGINDRPGSPLSLSSRIEPNYPPANYIVTRDGGEHSDSESRPRNQPQHNHHQPQPNGTSISLEIRQPRPRRHRPVDISNNLVHSPDASPTRSELPFEMKESISGIVKDALKPHWKSGQLTADQYANINRDLSHRLYKEVSEQELNDQARSRFEKIATKEVARAIADIKA